MPTQWDRLLLLAVAVVSATVLSLLLAGHTAATSSHAQEQAQPFERVATRTLESGEDQLVAAVIDPAGEFAYLGTSAGVVKLDLATFQRVDMLPAGAPRAGVIDPAGRFAYFGIPWSSPGRMMRIDLDDFNTVEEATLELGDRGFAAAIMDPAGRYAYLGTSGPPPVPGAFPPDLGYTARLVKVDLETFARVGANWMATSEYRIDAAAIDAGGRFAYLGVTRTGWPALVKVDLHTMSRAAVLYVPETTSAGPVVMDPAGEFVYFGTVGASPTLVKIDLDSFEQVDAIDVSGSLRSAVMDPNGTYAYVTAGAQALKIDLDAFEVVDAIPLADGVRSFAAAAVDPAGEFAYFGDAIADPGLVVKVRIGPHDTAPIPPADPEEPSRPDDPDAPVGPDPAPGLACPPAEVPSAGFHDVPDGGTHTAAIDCVAWYGIAQGRTATSYAPGTPVDRAQMASFVARLIAAAGGELPEATDQGFVDLEHAGVHTDPINRLAAAGVVRGRTASSYEPAAQVTRAQMATFLVNAYEYVADTTLPSGTTTFTDIAGNTHETTIEMAATAGFALGTTATSYAPQEPVRRDQMASFLSRVLERFAADGNQLQHG